MFPELHQLGKILILGGIVVILLGAFFLLGDKIPLIGKLPGDIYIRRKNFTFYFPLATCIVLSLLISLIVYLFKK